MRTRGVMVLLTCTGCNLVFGIEPPPPRPDAPADANVPPAPTCTTDRGLVDLPLVADTYLDAEAPAIAHGTERVLRLTPARSVLLRFAKGANVLYAISFELPLAPLATGCAMGDACEACPAPMDGMARLSFIKPTWNEQEATQLDRSAGTPWDQAGARGSEELGVACDALPFSPEVLACEAFVPATAQVFDEISVIVRVGAGGVGTFAAREGLTDCGARPLRAIGTCRVGLEDCGNGSIDSHEECDDGNLIDGDDCDSNCTVTACGNGILTSAEACDDGNTDNSDSCVAGCRTAVCGDGFIQLGVEECDDNNTSSGDGCSSICSMEQLP